MEEGAAAYAKEAAADFSVAVAQQNELKRLQHVQVCLLCVCTSMQISPFFLLLDIRRKKCLSARLLYVYAYIQIFRFAF